jgi:hypothetical protein
LNGFTWSNLLNLAVLAPKASQQSQMCLKIPKRQWLDDLDVRDSEAVQTQGAASQHQSTSVNSQHPDPPNSSRWPPSAHLGHPMAIPCPIGSHRFQLFEAPDFLRVKMSRYHGKKTI